MTTKYYKIKYNDSIEDIPKLREILNTNFYIGLIGRLAAQALEITTDDAIYIAFQPKTKTHTEERQLFRFEESLDECGLDWKRLKLDDIFGEGESLVKKESLESQIKRARSQKNSQR